MAAERARINTVLAQLETEKGAAEARARAMESVAYGTIIGLIVLVVIIASAFALRRRKTTTAAEHGSNKPETSKLAEPEPISGSKTTAAAEHPSVGPKTRELEPTEPAVVSEPESAPTTDSQRSESKGAKGASSTAASSSQAAQVPPSTRASAPTVIVGIVNRRYVIRSRYWNGSVLENAESI